MPKKDHQRAGSKERNLQSYGDFATEGSRLGVVNANRYRSEHINSNVKVKQVPIRAYKQQRRSKTGADQSI